MAKANQFVPHRVVDLIDSNTPYHDQPVGYWDLKFGFHEAMTRAWGFPDEDSRLGAFHLNYESMRIYVCTNVVTKINTGYGIETERTWTRAYSIRYDDHAEWLCWMRGAYRVMEQI